ncbi:MAG TPA: TetR family transcriptional regulator [Kineosporiaceae bacterium]|nr:TetR family transcriptional regulator [Kineosporiaceae bacterium]
MAAGIALADRDGLNGLSPRRLAQELGVNPMSLYHHVRDKDALLERRRLAEAARS